MSGTDESIYNAITDMSMWKHWDVWNDDHTLNVKISSPSKGVGARYRWKSKIREIKDGLIVIRETEPFYRVGLDLYYGKKRRGLIEFNLEPTIEATSVTCTLTINNHGKIFPRYLAWFILKEADRDIEAFLLKIDEHSGYQKGTKAEFSEIENEA